MKCSFIVQEEIRLSIEISDEDIDLNTGARSLIRIQNFIYEIPRSQPTSTAFSSLQTLESSHTPPLRLTFRFRLTCTPGSCGSDCTQTSNCTPFPNACELECNNAMQCQNGGRCMVRKYTEKDIPKENVYLQIFCPKLKLFIHP